MRSHLQQRPPPDTSRWVTTARACVPRNSYNNSSKNNNHATMSVSAGVQYYDSDFSYEEHEAEYKDKFECSLSSALATLTTKRTVVDEDLNPSIQRDCWDGFHASHSHGNFFKSRRYITKAFPCILDQCNRVILEIGCGSGSTCLPILKQSVHPPRSKAVLLACDSSPIAVETTITCITKAMATKTNLGASGSEGDENEQSTSNETQPLFTAFVSDPSLEKIESDKTTLESAEEAYRKLFPETNNEDRPHATSNGIADVTICVFVLSAVRPNRVHRFLSQIHQCTRPGGKVCFRDYGVYDVPMLRFDPVTAFVRLDDDGIRDYDDAPPRLFMRGDGTLSRFFHVETIQILFEDVGFVVEELRYATVFNDNRKTKQRLKRVFVHGLFRRPE